MDIILSALLFLCAKDHPCEIKANQCIQEQKLEYIEPLSYDQQHEVFDKCFSESLKALKETK